MRTQRLILSVTVAAAVLAPAAAFASSEFHPANGEIGYTQHPSHAQPSNVTRGEVTAEVDAARKAGWFYNSQRYGIFPSTTVGTPKTRAQVGAELRAEKPAERRARNEQYKGGQ